MDQHPEITKDDPPASRSSRRGPWVVVLVLAAAIVGGYVLLKPGSNEEQLTQRTRVTSFRGTGNETTDTFRVTKPWRVDWKSTGKRFAFAITGDRDFGTVIDRKKPGSGTTSAVGTGTYRLVIKAKGAWSVRISEER
jgi:hypothetical protein